MIKSLNTENIGLSSEMSVEWANRFNLITGDNGLGKSFLLDLSWWALTRTWASQQIMPQRGKKFGEVSYEIKDRSGTSAYKNKFDISGSDLRPRPPSTAVDCVVVYVRAEGGYSVWDPIRNFWHNIPGRPDAYHFTSSEVWDGLEIQGVRVCEGLERDWVSWQKGNERQFEALKEALVTLSPPDEPIQPAAPMRVFLGEGRDRPTITIAGQVVPLIHASSGIRRILALAYLLVWSWYESKAAAELAAEPHPGRYVILFDEPETHLHPRWQRTILPSLREALRNLEEGYTREPQVIVATHSPLVLASMEPFFDPTKDDLIHLDLRNGEVVLEQGFWEKQGDATNWLTSETFGLDEARSLPAERAIEAAQAFIRGDAEALPEGLDDRTKIDAALRQLLPDHDPFWAEWLVETEAVGD